MVVVAEVEVGLVVGLVEGGPVVVGLIRGGEDRRKLEAEESDFGFHSALRKVVVIMVRKLRGGLDRRWVRRVGGRPRRTYFLRVEYCATLLFKCGFNRSAANQGRSLVD